ncbi:MAG: NfeD family protein [Ruminiclostridium sp.]|nr:NfeD family protein [Ruminiclostridium sp.]
MFEWWNSLGIVLQVFYCIAIPATLVIIIQTILIMLGMGDDCSGGADMNPSDTSGLSGVDGDITDLPDAAGHGEVMDGSCAHDVGAMQIFTLQGIMTFLCVFGWSGIIFTSVGLHIAITILISLVLGFGAMVGVAKLIQLTGKLAQNGTVNVKNLLGAKATVYVPVPAKGKGQGKVNVAVGEIFSEFSAITDEDESIPTNTSVRIIDVRGDVVVVEIDD